MIIEEVQEDFRNQEYSIFTEEALGFPDLRLAILEELYTPERLPPVGDVRGPVTDRYRAKDFCVYRWIDGVVSLERVTRADLMRLGTGDARLAARTDFLGVPRCAEFVKTLLALIPPERRTETGTWGVHTFRSFSKVVDGPHQDGFEYGGVYVLDRVGGGAESYLVTPGTRAPIMTYQLQPGEVLLFKDAQFEHGATPLQGGADCRRDALVIQINAPEDLEAAWLGGLL